jgi:hypothetical protein
MDRTRDPRSRGAGTIRRRENGMIHTRSLSPEAIAT